MTGWFRLGDLELCVVSDGVMRQDAGAVFGLVPRIMWEPYAGKLDEKYRMTLGLNCLIVRGSGKTVLIETGIGNKGAKGPGAVSTHEGGALLDNLAREGVRPADIDVVINTHLHFDHCGGNTVLRDGKPAPAFPRARYLLQEGELEAARHSNERTRSTYLPENFEPLADAGQLEAVRGEAEVMKGVRITPAPGHTADHGIVEMESGGEVAIYIGELAQHPVMLERLAWVSAFDILPLVSLETKRRFIEKAIDRRALLISVHAAYPGLGRLHLEGSRRKWQDG